MDASCLSKEEKLLLDMAEGESPDQQVFHVHLLRQGLPGWSDMDWVEELRPIQRELQRCIEACVRQGRHGDARALAALRGHFFSLARGVDLKQVVRMLDESPETPEDAGSRPGPQNFHRVLKKRRAETGGKPRKRMISWPVLSAMALIVILAALLPFLKPRKNGHAEVAPLQFEEIPATELGLHLQADLCILNGGKLVIITRAAVGIPEKSELDACLKANRLGVSSISVQSPSGQVILSLPP